MGLIRSEVKKFYCAFCRTQRSIKNQIHVQLFEVLLCLAASLILMLFFWQNLDFRFIAIFAMLVIVYEFFVQIKQRMLMSCPHCGFDPVLYKKNVKACVEKVKVHLQARQNNPVMLLSKTPKLNLPIRKKTQKLEKKMAVAVTKSKQGKNLDVRL